MSDFLYAFVIVVAVTFAGTALIVLSACVLAGRADSVIDEGEPDGRRDR